MKRTPKEFVEDYRSRKTYAELRFTSVLLDPVTVTQVLVLPPDEQYRVGEPRLERRESDGSVVELTPHRIGYWAMSSQRWVKSEQLVDHLDWLLSELEPRSFYLYLFLEAGVRVEIRGFDEAEWHVKELPDELHQRARKLTVPIVCSTDE